MYKGVSTSCKNQDITIPNIYSDHSALSLSIISEEKEVKRGPGFCKFNNSLLPDKDYTELISQKIPEFASKYREVTDKGLLWDMIKMEIRAATILFSKIKARQKPDEEKKLLAKIPSSPRPNPYKL